MSLIQQLMLSQLRNHSKEARAKMIAELAGMLRSGRLYEYPLIVEHLASALEAIAHGKDANAALMPVPRKRPKTGEAYMERVAIAEVVRYYYLQEFPLRPSKNKRGAYELAKEHLEQAGTHKSEGTIQAAYLEQLEIMERREKRVATRGETPPWWMPRKS